MKSDKELGFTFINYEVCNYCQNIVRASISSYTSYNAYGCGLIKNELGQYARLTFMEGGIEPIIKSLGVDVQNTLNTLKGCENFEPNDMPIHPSILEEMIEKNKKAKSIPVDPNAIETSHDFSEKLDKYNKRIPMFMEVNGKEYRTVQ